MGPSLRGSKQISNDLPISAISSNVNAFFPKEGKLIMTNRVLEQNIQSLSVIFVFFFFFSSFLSFAIITKQDFVYFYLILVVTISASSHLAREKINSITL